MTTRFFTAFVTFLVPTLSFWSSPVSATPITTPLVSTFDSGCGGWLGDTTGTCDQDGTPSAGLSWMPSGGTPGGFLRFAEDSTVGYAIAPAAFLGDWSALDGVGFISYDHEVINSGSHVAAVGAELIILGANGSASATWTGAVACSGQSCSTIWQTFTAPLNETDWVVAGSWSSLLADVEEVRLRVDHYNTLGVTQLEGYDNFCLTDVPCPVPEPSVALLIGGSLGLATWRALFSRRRRPTA